MFFIDHCTRLCLILVDHVKICFYIRWNCLFHQNITRVLFKRCNIPLDCFSLTYNVSSSVLVWKDIFLSKFYNKILVQITFTIYSLLISKQPGYFIHFEWCQHTSTVGKIRMWWLASPRDLNQICVLGFTL